MREEEDFVFVFVFFIMEMDCREFREEKDLDFVDGNELQTKRKNR